MERDSLIMSEKEKLTSGDAKAALDSIKTMESAGYRRAIPSRWFGASIAFFIACLFALYALENPYPYIVLPILGIGVLIATTREKIGAYGRDFPGTIANRLAFALFATFMVAAFFGMVFVRRAYDLTWVPIVVGMVVGVAVFLASESERRSYIAKAGAGQTE